MLVISLGGISIWQVFRYAWSHAPPISFLGRLVTGRWVITSYDVAKRSASLVRRCSCARPKQGYVTRQPRLEAADVLDRLYYRLGAMHAMAKENTTWPSPESIGRSPS